MAGPQIPAGQVSRTVARSIDVLPTLADYAGLPRLSDVDGRSLRPAADGHEMADAPSYAESLYPELELGWAPLYAWRVGGLKFIKAPRPELYDLASDASETTNRIDAQHATRERAGPYASTRRSVAYRNRSRRVRSTRRRPRGCGHWAM